jgi:hypothetical protein
LRVNIVFGLLLVLFGGTAALLLGRERVAHTAPAAPQPTASDTVADAGTSAAAASGSASAQGSDGGPAKLMDRPLRTVALGWDLAAPAVLANGGLDPTEASAFTTAGVTTYLHPLESMSAVESALARGGGDREGADIAIVPLSELTASYERLRALSPEIFFVVGWSRGREALLSSRDTLPSPGEKPDPKAGDKSGVAMAGMAGEPATLLGLFALDIHGVPPTGVRLVARTDNPALAAVDRDAPVDGARQKILVTTADASRLIPFVAIAPHGLLDSHPAAFVAWSRVWVEAARKLASDPPAAARTIAGAPGAPEPIALLKRLGEISPASLADNARAFGLSGRGAVTLDALFQQAWRLWRGASVLATPAPDTSPINGSIVAALARSYPSLTETAPVKFKAPASLDTLKVLVAYRQPEGKFDNAALLATAGLLADVFERSTLQLSVTKAGILDTAATKHLADELAQRFDIAPERLVVAKKAPAKASAGVEILVAP